MDRPQQFSTRDMLVAVTAIACGLGLLVGFWRIAMGSGSQAAAWGACISGSALIGTGCGSFFHAKTDGAVVGTLIGALIAPNAIYYLASWLIYP